MTDEELRALATEIAADGKPVRFVLRVEWLAQVREMERRRTHWYWRAWWRLRYLPAAVAGWLMERVTS